LNPALQAAAETSRETIIDLQKIRLDLRKLKNMLHEITNRRSIAEQSDQEEENNADETEERRIQMKFTKRISPILNLLTPDTIRKYFGSENHEEIWNELNTQEECRGRVIEWLEAMITSNVSGEIEGMNKRAQALKVQEAYRTSKGITMRRFIDKQQSPQCQVDMQIVTEHFQETWSRPDEKFVEMGEDSIFHLEE
jgi:hypothetical protein